MKKPYIDVTFTGVKTFTEVLDEAMVSYRVFASSKIDFLFDTASEYLDKEKDVLELGSCTRGNQELYYLQVGMKITKSFMSHIVFVFDHYPEKDELKTTLADLLALTENRLDSVQDEVGPVLMDEAAKKRFIN